MVVVVVIAADAAVVVEISSVVAFSPVTTKFSTAFVTWPLESSFLGTNMVAAAAAAAARVLSDRCMSLRRTKCKLNETHAKGNANTKTGQGEKYVLVLERAQSQTSMAKLVVVAAAAAAAGCAEEVAIQATRAIGTTLKGC